jgi:hypothetical protein
VEAAYARLRENIEAKDVRAESLKATALEALDTAKTKVELEPDGIANKVRRP